MRKNIIFTLMLTLALNLLTPVYASTAWDGTVATGFAGGEGTESSPYLIENASQLAYLSAVAKKESANTANYATKEKYYKLTADIDLGNVEWTAIEDFRGVFDGNAHVISNLKIGSGASYRGLFGQNYGTISDLTVKDATVEDSISSSTIGVICCYNSGTIEYSGFTGNFDTGEGKQLYVGVIAGRMSGSSAVIRYCEVKNADIDGKLSTFGIIAGYLSRGCNIYQCRIDTVDVDIEGGCTNVGGAVGYTNSSSVNDIYVKGLDISVGDFSTTISSYFGGIAGRAVSSYIKNCYISDGNLISNPDVQWHYFGGIAGSIQSGNITNCYSNLNLILNMSKDSIWPYSVGGIAGYAVDTYIKNCISTAKYSLTDSTTSKDNTLEVGGICGRSSSWAWAENCVNDSSINGTDGAYTNIGYIIANEESTEYAVNCYYNSANTLSGGKTTLQCATEPISNTKDVTFLKNTVGLLEYTPTTTDELYVWLYGTTDYPEIYSIYNKCVTYSANGGENEPASQFIKYYSGDTLSQTVPTKNGCKFKEWNTQADGTGTSYTTGQDISTSSEGFLKLYAIWEEIPSTVTTVIQQTGYKAYIVEATGIPENANIIIACYNGDSFVLAKILDEELKTTISDSVVYDKTKTFVWKDLTPIKEPEIK